MNLAGSPLLHPIFPSSCGAKIMGQIIGRRDSPFFDRVLEHRKCEDNTLNGKIFFPTANFAARCSFDLKRSFEVPFIYSQFPWAILALSNSVKKNNSKI